VERYPMQETFSSFGVQTLWHAVFFDSMGKFTAAR
jgi:hypothetical protein